MDEADDIAEYAARILTALPNENDGPIVPGGFRRNSAEITQAFCLLESGKAAFLVFISII